MESGKNKFVKIIAALLILAMIVGGLALALYKGHATKLETTYLLRLNANDNVESLTIKLEKECGLKYPWVFKKLAGRMNLEHWLKKGRYHVKPDMTLVDIVRLLREGKGKTVNFTIRSLGTMESFADNCGAKLEADTADFLNLLNDSRFLDSLGFTTQTVYALPLPDTYNLFWHTEPDELLIRLKIEYDKFWNRERKEKAEKIGLSPIQIATLASIVSKETNKTDEMPQVAGMYLNRLKIDMPLQADPTIKFALNEPTLQRIYNVHLKVVSPYNTYANKGLPPGPICIASKEAIEAVLNHSEHSYLYMCAKEDFSGYHNFATTYAEHLRNAKKYQQALDRNGVE